MNILHTADWHLGQRFCDRDRADEHAAFLLWLLAVIQDREIDALIHAGDVFDTGNPPSYALEMYYNFLRDVSRICPNVIITGGNHDSPATLNAPKELLKALNIHVVGATTGNPADEKIILKNKSGNAAVVCAVPYLRDKDIRFSVSGESADERERRVREGIRRHYEDVAALVHEEKQRGLPVIATGHLFAAGSELSDAEHSIMGNLGQVTADTFPAVFDYVALGHIHRPQVIGKQERIRYSGSPLPLSFSEIAHPHSVMVVEFSEGKLGSIEKIEVPRTRQLLRFEGSPEEITRKIQSFSSSDLLPAWVEAIAELDAPNPHWAQEAKSAAAGKPLEIIKFTVKKTAARSIAEVEEDRDLRELTALEVFELRCEAANFSREITEELTLTFGELLEIMREDAA